MGVGWVEGGKCRERAAAGSQHFTEEVNKKAGGHKFNGVKGGTRGRGWGGVRWGGVGRDYE